MDLFFQQELQMEMLWLDIPEIQTPDHALRFSAFAPYTRPCNGFSVQNSDSPSEHHRNLNKRMIEILRAIRKSGVVYREPLYKYRHLINERQRRGKMRQNYVDLHSLLPPRTKADKNSIVQVAASHVLKLQDLKKELQSKNDELEAMLAKKTEKADVSKINLRVLNPHSPIDSMVEVLKCLKGKEVKARAIRSKISGEEFSAELEIGSKIKTFEMQKAVESTLEEVERKPRRYFAEARNSEVIDNLNFWEGRTSGRIRGLAGVSFDR